MKPLFVSLVLTLFGFGLGWYSRGLFVPSETENNLHTTQTPSRIASDSDLRLGERFAPEADGASEAHIPPSIAETITTEKTQKKSEESALNVIESTVDEFKRLVDSEQYEQAVIYYGKYATLNSKTQPLMRSIMRNALQGYLVNHDADRFYAFSDAWLSSFYNDTDVLILVTQFRREQGQLEEALNILQLANTYASTGADRSNTNSALLTFVAETDNMLARQGDWWRLQGFYEGLQSRDLAQPEDLLRLAELYLANGRDSEGRGMLQQLASDSQVRSKVEGLLNLFNNSRNFQPKKNRADDFASTIAMRRHGRHYLLPLSSGQSSDVSLILDTGASITLLTESAFQRFTQNSRKRFLGEQVFNTANGLARGSSYRVFDVKFGPHRLESLVVSVADNDFGDHVDGLLGMNVLQQFVFQIDQDKNELKLTRRSAH